MTQPSRLSGFTPLSPPGESTGPPWFNQYPHASVRRITEVETVQKAAVQAATEQVILLHSIRRILLTVMVLVPLAAAAILLVLLTVANGGGP